jgi:hypothetical protein
MKWKMEIKGLLGVVGLRGIEDGVDGLLGNLQEKK